MGWHSHNDAVGRSCSCCSSFHCGGDDDGGFCWMKSGDDVRYDGGLYVLDGDLCVLGDVRGAHGADDYDDDDDDDSDV